MTFDPVPAQHGHKAHYHIKKASAKWQSFRAAMFAASNGIVQQRSEKNANGINK